MAPISSPHPPPLSVFPHFSCANLRMETSISAGEDHHENAASDGKSALIFLGTGCSSMVLNIMCLIQPADPPCSVCIQSMSVPPEKNPNYRCNTSLLIDYCESNGNHKYILIDVGKTFREQVLRWFIAHQIPKIDSGSPYHKPSLCKFIIDGLCLYFRLGSACVGYSLPIFCCLLVNFII